MQDEIVARVAGALNAPLIAAEAQKAEHSANPASTDLYFQGMAWVNKGLRPNWLDRARSCFEKAKAIDDFQLGSANRRCHGRYASGYRLCRR